MVSYVLYPCDYYHLCISTALYNPLLDDSDKKTIQDLTRTPNEIIPPLIELSARAILRHGLQWKPGDLPKRLEGENLFPGEIQVYFISLSSDATEQRMV